MCCYVSLIISLLITQLHTVSVSHDIVEDGGRGGSGGKGFGKRGFYLEMIMIFNNNNFEDDDNNDRCRLHKRRYIVTLIIIII